MGDDCYHFSDIAGYNFLHKPRVNRIGGGVGLYTGEHLNYKERHDLSFPDDKSAESLFVEINWTKEKNIIVNSIFLDAANEQEIIEICGTCCSGTAVGYDNISMNLIKESIDIIISPLTCIINLSITSGIVPKQSKIVRIIPLFKSGEQDIFTNYRPVSVLPALSKILRESNVQSSFKVS